jgi:hypothetical protein
MIWDASARVARRADRGSLWLVALALVSRTSGADPSAVSAPASPSTATVTSNLDTHVATGFATYADTDHVFVQTPSISGEVVNPVSGYSVNASYLADVVSAASVDIVATASRRWEEVRQAGTLGANYKPHNFGVSVSGAISDEPDYLSLTAGGSMTQDFNEKNLTLLFGYFHTYDLAGRSGTPFSVFSETLDVETFKLGAQMVVNRRTTLSLLLDALYEHGNQAKPYRYIPLFLPGTNVPLGASIDTVNSLRVSERPLESLPLSRQRYALSAGLAHRYERSTLRLEERVYGDSWLLFATTTDARVLLDLGSRVETGPHARLHVQNGVDFWERAYTFLPGFNYPQYRTGDRELGPLVDVTGGWKLAIGLGKKGTPMSWVLGFDTDFISTRFLDDLYITQRTAVLAGTSLEANL